MSWLDRLLGRPVPEATERAGDRQALDELSAAGDNVHRRTQRLIEDYRVADQRILAQRRAARKQP